MQRQKAEVVESASPKLNKQRIFNRGLRGFSRIVESASPKLFMQAGPLSVGMIA